MLRALRWALCAAGGLTAVLGLAVLYGWVPSIALGLLLAALSTLAVWLALIGHRRAKALARARDELDAHVRERTAELARANQTLTEQIAERERVEETLRASEQRYRALFDNANDLVYVLDLEGNFISVNKAAERITGYTATEARKMNMAQVLDPEDFKRAQAIIAQKLGGERNAIHEVALLAKDGRRLTLEVSSHLVYENGIPVAVEGIARDITERRRLEEQFIQSQKMEAIGRLAGGLAHDFNNLLTVISAYGQMIGEALPPDPRLRGYTQEILWAAERAGALTNRLLAFSRRQVVQPRIVDLNRLIVTLENMLRRLIGEDIELQIALEPEPAAIQADPSHIEQVIMNLVVNARDAMQNGGRLTLKAGRVELDDQLAGDRPALPPGSYVVLEVIDTGTGMDAEVLSHLFEPFFTTKAPGKGTGLGLSTVYGLVKQCAGDIQVRTEPGKGSSFTLHFPRVEDAEVPRPAPPPATARFTGRRETILLVEDDSAVRQLAREVLLQQGYRVLEAGTGEDALRLCEQLKEPVHALLSDVIMPNMSGFELAKRLRAAHPHLKVLYITGYAQDAITEHGILEEGAALLTKPFLAETLAQKLREVIESD